MIRGICGSVSVYLTFEVLRPARSKDVVRLLIENGAEIDKVNVHGRTALMEAAAGDVRSLLMISLSTELLPRSKIYMARLH
jgi:hypothetical protein